MTVDFDRLQDSVAQLVVDVSEDPKLKERVEKEPHSALMDRLPAPAAKNMEPQQVQEFARLVLEGAAQIQQRGNAADAGRMDAAPGRGGARGGFLCPACHPTIYAALAAGGIAGIVATAGTGAAAIAAIVPAAATIVTAVTGLSGPAATAVVHAALTGAGGNVLQNLDKILNLIAGEVCKHLGC
jgi:hypothetical protein